MFDKSKTELKIMNFICGSGIWKIPKDTASVSPLNRKRQSLAQELLFTEVSFIKRSL